MIGREPIPAGMSALQEFADRMTREARKSMQQASAAREAPKAVALENK